MGSTAPLLGACRPAPRSSPCGGACGRGVPSVTGWHYVQEDADGARGQRVVWRGCGEHTSGSPRPGPRQAVPLGQAHSLEAQQKRARLQRRRRRVHPWIRKTPWRGEWQPAPVFLPGKSVGQRSLVGCSPRGRKEEDTTRRPNAAAARLTRRSPVHLGLALGGVRTPGPGGPWPPGTGATPAASRCGGGRGPHFRADAGGVRFG